jgi:tRNA (guanine-N7-)-methyltransferase
MKPGPYNPATLEPSFSRCRSLETSHPPIRSYVLRQGRFSPGQQRAYAEWMPRYGVPYAAQPLDAHAVFGRAAPLIVEIGSGMGETTASIAAAHPDLDYLAIEVHVPGVGSLLRQVGELGLTNVRVIQHDAVEVMRDMIAPGTLAAVHVFFPDPWPKKRHHKRRLIQPAMARLVAERLGPGGMLHVATDWHEYAEQILAVLAAEPLLSNPGGGFVERPASRPQTKFEKRGQSLGHPVRDLIFHRLRPSR